MGHRYSTSAKETVIRLYESGTRVCTIRQLTGMSNNNIYRLIRSYNQSGFSGLPSPGYRVYSASYKLKIVLEVLKKGLTCNQVSSLRGLGESSVRTWVRQYNQGGYDSLLPFCRISHKAITMGRPKKKEPETELEILQARVEYLEIENALLKKVKALIEEREAQLHALGQKPSKN